MKKTINKITIDNNVFNFLFKITTILKTISCIPHDLSSNELIQIAIYG